MSMGESSPSTEECPFCAIVRGEAPASIAYQDDRVVAFMDILPINPGHLLVVPKQHVPFMHDLDETVGMHLFRIAVRIQQAVRSSGVRCEGIDLFLADGAAAGQEVFHLHLHVFPRFQGDSFRIHYTPSRPSRQELDANAGEIRQAYGVLWQ